ncbi:rRNA maturation RNase YbeY [Gammaproteobacteria bacterium]|jgi:probable rRNA maturation factor|nr:rRNA maturation RNase YbeY [SAR86 cluster bacterium]MDA8709710.1 rRNA maturation RNase YbeY [Gammaproteobacteria bacterium]MBL6701707.1 rRNA maturation RNase YbeY [SAR86 cluster bacterium]MBL6822689.1 rRNA maturation RNase YbeY [SAR86 cluster bacterium]MDA8781048.1 rRNA maturation RNase YbeY [Gammaproteobacteria bacterium]
MTNLINKKLSLNILSHDFNELASELESKLELLTKHILFDQNKNTLKVNLKLISSKEMMKLNEEFREKRIDTNVLSFPADGEIQKISGELGDIAISIPYVQSESKNLNRDLDDHMMHLLAHGILHLLGFDHKEDQDANIMEAQEIKYLEFFKIANPYIL